MRCVAKKVNKGLIRRLSILSSLQAIASSLDLELYQSDKPYAWSDWGEVLVDGSYRDQDWE